MSYIYPRLILVLLFAATLLGSAGVAPAEAAASAVSAPARRQSRAVAPAAITASTDPWPARLAAEIERISAHAGRSAAVADPTRDTTLAMALGSIGRDVRIGVHARRLDAPVALVDLDGAAALNPASNHKLVTAIAALELLGPDYRFETRVLRRDRTLVLVGSGDPSLQLDDLATLAASVRARVDLADIDRIVVDDTAFSRERYAPGFDDGGPGYSYMAPSGALSVQWNTVEVTVLPTTRGAPVEVIIDPPSPHVRVEITATTGGGGALDVTTHAAGETTVVRVAGRVSPRHGPQTVRRRITDPARFTAGAFQIALGGPAPNWTIERGRAEADDRLLAVHRSAPLPEALHSALKFSNNFTTEQVLRTLGHRMSGEPGDWRNGSAALARFWTALGRRPDEIVFENASGYSRRGRVTARAIVDLLAWSQRPGSRSADVVSALPASGTDGTLRDRLPDSLGRVRAKTGTLAGASALSGVIVDAHGRPVIVFSVLVNGSISGRSAHALEDRIVRTLLAHA